MSAPVFLGDTPMGGECTLCIGCMVCLTGAPVGLVVAALFVSI